MCVRRARWRWWIEGGFGGGWEVWIGVLEGGEDVGG